MICLELSVARLTARACSRNIAKLETDAVSYLVPPKDRKICSFATSKPSPILKKPTFVSAIRAFTKLGTKVIGHYQSAQDKEKEVLFLGILRKLNFLVSEMELNWQRLITLRKSISYQKLMQLDKRASDK